MKQKQIYEETLPKIVSLSILSDNKQLFMHTDKKHLGITTPTSLYMLHPNYQINKKRILCEKNKSITHT